MGVFVDIEEGEVGFYDVGHHTHIYSFTSCRFPRVKLRPYFNLYIHESTNTAKMVLTPVSCVSQSDLNSNSDLGSDSE